MTALPPERAEVTTDSADVDRWLISNGWSPTRDIGPRADQLIAVRVEDAARQGSPLTVIDSAVRFIRSYGDLELPLPKTSPERVLILKPTIGYDGDAEDFIELARNIGSKVFPVAYETVEGGIWLIDESSRFFYWHSTGGYFLGSSEREAFTAAFVGTPLPDAEDYYA